jgi:hypothetical protein
VYRMCSHDTLAGLWISLRYDPGSEYSLRMLAPNRVYSEVQDVPLVATHAVRVQSVGGQRLLVQFANGSRGVLHVPARQRENDIG